MNHRIKEVKAREVLNSRGNFTVEVELETEGGIFVASCPSGASKGKGEAIEKKPFEAVKNINEIIGPKLKGEDPVKQGEIDRMLIEMDGTKNKSNLGVNAILPVSLAVCRAGAASKKMPLYQYIREMANDYGLEIENWRMPRPSFNIINGGVHSGSSLSIQEFMVVPKKELFLENLKIGCDTYHSLKKILLNLFGKESINIGDEGGFVPFVSLTEEALGLINKLIEEKEEPVEIGLDCAAGQFYKQEKNYYLIDGKIFNQIELLDFYEGLVQNYPIIFLEDPFEENDWDSFTEINSKFKNRVVIFGDDILVTNKERMKEAKRREACSGTIIKPNQVGTLIETIEAIKVARSFKWKIMISHRSGDTCDDFIADLAVGVGADFIKSGAPARGERVIKYNRLLKIEKELF